MNIVNNLYRIMEYGFKEDSYGLINFIIQIDRCKDHN